MARHIVQEHGEIQGLRRWGKSGRAPPAHAASQAPGSSTAHAASQVPGSSAAHTAEQLAALRISDPAGRTPHAGAPPAGETPGTEAPRQPGRNVDPHAPARRRSRPPKARAGDRFPSPAGSGSEDTEGRGRLERGDSQRSIGSESSTRSGWSTGSGWSMVSRI